MLLIALVGGFVPQFRQRQTAAADTKELAIPTVAVVSPTATTPQVGLTYQLKSNRGRKHPSSRE